MRCLRQGMRCFGEGEIRIVSVRAEKIKIWISGFALEIQSGFTQHYLWVVLELVHGGPTGCRLLGR